jgi:hypothetical protein
MVFLNKCGENQRREPDSKTWRGNINNGSGTKNISVIIRRPLSSREHL